MAIEASNSYMAGNGNFNIVGMNLADANQDKPEKSPLKQVIDTFNNADGSFDDKMRRTFDNLNEIEPNFNSQEALRATDPIQILMDWIEQAEKEEQDKDVVSSADEVLSQLREEQERERIRAMQDDYSQTFTNDELDQMEWRGNPNEVWSLGGKKSTRRQFVDAFKETRDDLDKIAIENNWSPDKKNHEDHLLSAAAQAATNRDYSKANEYVERMDPKTKEQFNRNVERTVAKNADINLQNDGRLASNEMVSNQAREDLFAKGPNSNTVELAAGGSVKSPIQLTQTFNPISSNSLESLTQLSNEKLSQSPQMNAPNQKVAALNVSMDL